MATDFRGAVINHRFFVGRAGIPAKELCGVARTITRSPKLPNRFASDDNINNKVQVFCGCYNWITSKVVMGTSICAAGFPQRRSHCLRPTPVAWARVFVLFQAGFREPCLPSANSIDRLASESRRDLLFSPLLRGSSPTCEQSNKHLALMDYEQQDVNSGPMSGKGNFKSQENQSIKGSP